MVPRDLSIYLPAYQPTHLGVLLVTLDFSFSVESFGVLFSNGHSFLTGTID